jgi:hypothetical protein
LEAILPAGSNLDPKTSERLNSYHSFLKIAISWYGGPNGKAPAWQVQGPEFNPQNQGKKSICSSYISVRNFCPFRKKTKYCFKKICPGSRE